MLARWRRAVPNDADAAMDPVDDPAPMNVPSLMNVYVITPYFQTPPDWLETCHRSVRAQSQPATHILVCDGSAPMPFADFQGVHVILRRNYADYGNTPRLIGCYRAVASGADAIAFLDADNWYHPDHLRDLIAHARAGGFDVVSSTRMLHRLDGTPLLRCPHVNGTTVIDTNCLLVMRSAFPHLLGWVMAGQDQAAVADQVVWQYLQSQRMKTGFLDIPSVAYRTRHRVHYQLAGEAPPDGTVTRTDPSGNRYQ